MRRGNPGGGGKLVGAARMTPQAEAELDRATGCGQVVPGKADTVAILLSDDKVPSVRVIVQDPVTDAELYRSPADLPVRLL